MRIMGIDVGSKKIGIALSDPLGIVANPWGYLDAGDLVSVIEKIRHLVDEYSVETLVIGLPKNMDGSLGGQAEKAQKFAQVLQEEISITINMVDERLSSREVEGMLIDAGIRRKKRKTVNDKLAATIILQKYLDMQKREKFDV